MRWGTVPSFAAEIDRSATLFNARSESAELEPAFARPVRHRRCLVPMDGWYEWQHDPSSAEVGSVRNHGLGLLAPARPPPSSSPCSDARRRIRPRW